MTRDDVRIHLCTCLSVCHFVRLSDRPSVRSFSRLIICLRPSKLGIYREGRICMKGHGSWMIYGQRACIITERPWLCPFPLTPSPVMICDLRAIYYCYHVSNEYNICEGALEIFERFVSFQKT